MEKKRKTEIAVVIAVILIAAVVLGIRFNMQGRMAKEKALLSELQATRISVQLYLTLNKSLPEDLSALTTENYTIGNTRGIYLTGVGIDDQSYPVDSFGNAFGYDPDTGRVFSGTEKYAAW